MVYGEQRRLDFSDVTMPPFTHPPPPIECVDDGGKGGERGKGGEGDLLAV